MAVEIDIRGLYAPEAIQKKHKRIMYIERLQQQRHLLFLMLVYILLFLRSAVCVPFPTTSAFISFLSNNV